MYLTILIVAVWGWGIYLAVRAIHDVRTSQGVLSWVLLLVLLPPVGIPLFMMLGDRRLDGYVRARRGGRSKLDAIAQTALTSLKARESIPDDPTLRLLSGLAKLPWTSGNVVKIFTNADGFYADLITDLNSARQYILIQFYIYRDDQSGRAVRAALLDAIKRGVKVYMMYDEVGCSGTPSAYFDEVANAGGNVSGFKTVQRKRRFLRLNFRNHRKLVVLDGRVVYFGGMNIGDEYRGMDDTVGHWRDTHARSAGPAALSAQLVFLEDWHWAKDRNIDGIDWTLDAVNAGPPTFKPAGEEVGRMLLFPSGPVDDREAGLLMFLQLISRASKRIWIATPYFVCDESIMQAITLAKLRGVDVRILVPETPDSTMVKYAAQSFIRDATASRVPVYQYSAGFTHQKIVLSDDVASIGSANLDHRSMKLNFELTGIMNDAAFADQVAAMLERDMARAKTIPQDWWENLGSWRRFLVRAARVAAPVL